MLRWRLAYPLGRAAPVNDSLPCFANLASRSNNKFSHGVRPQALISIKIAMKFRQPNVAYRNNVPN